MLRGLRESVCRLRGGDSLPCATAATGCERLPESVGADLAFGAADAPACPLAPFGTSRPAACDNGPIREGLSGQVDAGLVFIVAFGHASILPLTQRLPVSPEIPRVTPSELRAAVLAAVRRIQKALT